MAAPILGGIARYLLGRNLKPLAKAFRKELKKKDLPLEFAFIPFIESNYDPFSISASGAVGLWQFMPRTGESLDLNKTWWIEERHDPFKSTKAAISYLDILYQRFDEDMYLTLAAYNAGPSYIDKQIKRNKRKNKPSDYWSIKLSKETQNYIPKFIAINEIIFNVVWVCVFKVRNNYRNTF